MRRQRNRWITAWHALRGHAVVYGVDFGGTELSTSKLRAVGGGTIEFIESPSVALVVDDETAVQMDDWSWEHSGTEKADRTT